MANSLIWLQKSDLIIGLFNPLLANWESEGVVDCSANLGLPRNMWQQAGADFLTLSIFTISMSRVNAEDQTTKLTRF